MTLQLLYKILIIIEFKNEIHMNSKAKRKKKRFKTYSIEEILKKDDFEDNRTEETDSRCETQTQNTDNYGNNSMSTTHQMSVQQQLYYSYYCQALMAANYRQNTNNIINGSANSMSFEHLMPSSGQHLMTTTQQNLYQSSSIAQTTNSEYLNYT